MTRPAAASPDERPEPSALRRRIVAAAIELTTTTGWPSVTMSRLADAVDVSRQTVYNELGSKPALAEAMVFEELDRFLAVAARAFDEHPDDLVAAIRAAVRGVLTYAEDNPLLHAIVSASHGAVTDLLPLLTTYAEPLLTTAKNTVARRVRAYGTPLRPRELDVAIDLIVRTVLSHVMQPSDTPARTADGLAWFARRVLDA